MNRAVTGLLLVMLVGLSCRKPDGAGTERATPSSSPSAADPVPSAYESTADAFRATFPLPGPPRVIVDPPEIVEQGLLAGARATRVSYYVAGKDLTFLVEVRRFSQPLTNLPEWREWAISEMRVNAKRILQEREISTSTSHGERVVGVRVYAEMPSGVHVHNAMLFYGNRMYSIGAAPAALTDPATYDRFLSSLVLLDQAKGTH